MKTFLVTTIILLLTSIVASVTVFWYLQSSFGQNSNELEENTASKQVQTPEESVETSSNESGNTEVQENSTNVAPVEESGAQTEGEFEAEESGIPLRNLPLSDTQKSLIEGVGVDVETYVITPETISCAENALGSERFSEIVDGSSPSGFEMIKLVPCL